MSPAENRKLWDFCEQHRGLACRLAGQFVRRFPDLASFADLEDAKAEAMLALFDAAKHYDGIRPFAKYAAVAIKNNLLSWAKKSALIDMPARGDKLPPIQEPLPPDAEDLCGDSHFDLRAVMLSLDDCDRELIERRYFGKETLAEVAAVEGTNEMNVHRREQRALASLRSLMGVE